jgi:NitT/TauT family transport system substrate-binding protein
VRAWFRLACAALAVWFTAGLVSTGNAEPLRVAHTVWVGFGPLFIAREKGFFAREGVEAELINIDDHTAAFSGLFAGQIDAIAAGTQDVLTFAAPDEDRLVCVLPLDESRGGDGILATKDIRSIADLKDRTVAVPRGSLQQFYLAILLKEVGLTEADIEVVDLPAEDAGEAFMMQEVDAAVTFEPWLTPGRNVGHGHLLTDTSKQPGLITDCLETTAGVLGDRREEFKAVRRAWVAAVEYVKTHPDEAVEIMARSLGGGLKDPTAFAEVLKGVGIYDGAGIRAYLGTPENPGPIYQTMQHAIDVWSELGVLKVEVTPADVIAHGILDE